MDGTDTETLGCFLDPVLRERNTHTNSSKPGDTMTKTPEETTEAIELEKGEIATVIWTIPLCGGTPQRKTIRTPVKREEKQ